MNLLSRVFGSPTTWQMRAVGEPGLQELHPRELYKLLDAYYLNNGLYEYLAVSMYEQGIWKEPLKGLRNPAGRVVEFYPMHLWPGSLPGALPISADNKRIIGPIHQVWRWSNWGAQKQLAARMLAKYGDLFIKVAQNGYRDQVYMQLIEPEHVGDFEVDHRGYFTFIRLDVPQTKQEGGEDKSFTYTEVWDKNASSYRVWNHEKGLDANLEELGIPDVERILAPVPEWLDNDPAAVSEGSDELDSTDFVGVDFIPFVHAKFRDIGEDRGAGAFTLTLDKIDEANRKATRLAQMIFRYNKPLFGLRANAIDKDGRPIPAPRIAGQSGDGTDGDTIELGDDRLIRLPGNSQLEALVPDIDYTAHLEALKADLEELEQDLPELTYYRLRDTGNLSGRALQLLLAPAIKRAEEARGNAETALARADMMALTIGANAGLEGFADIGNYEAGDFEHSFRERDVMPLPESEEAETGKTYIDMGVPLKTILRRQGWSDADLKQLDKDLTEQRDQEQSSLAEATLRALRNFESGQADQGITQPPAIPGAGVPETTGTTVPPAGVENGAG